MRRILGSCESACLISAVRRWLTQEPGLRGAKSRSWGAIVTCCFVFATLQTPAVAQMVVGQVRVQALSPTLIRVEQKGPKGLEDRATLTVVKRDYVEVKGAVDSVDGGKLLKTAHYSVFVPADATTVAGVKVLDAEGSEIYVCTGKEPSEAFFPAPANVPQVWGFVDAPRVIPADWGAVPAPPHQVHLPNNGWDLENPAQDIYLFLTAGSYERLRRDFLELTGPVPLLPLYAYGLWYTKFYRYSQQTAMEEIDRFRRRGIPLDMFVLDTDWRVGGSDGYQVDTALFPDMQAFLAACHERDIRVMFNDHPSPVDPGNPLGRKELEFRANSLTSFLEMGLDAWWHDRNWYTQIESPHPELPLEAWGMRVYHDITKTLRPDRRPLIMSDLDGLRRRGYRIERYKPAHFSTHRYPGVASR